MDKENLTNLHRENKLPYFNGIFYKFKSPSRKVSDDEFVAIEEENNHHHHQDNKSYANFVSKSSVLSIQDSIRKELKSIKDDKSSISTNNKNEKEQKYDLNEYQNVKFVTNTNKKNLNDLDDLFNNISLDIPNVNNNTQSSNFYPNISDQNKDKFGNSHTISSLGFNNNSWVLPSNTTGTKINNFDDDEFVDIEENVPSSRKESVEISNFEKNQVIVTNSDYSPNLKNNLINIKEDDNIDKEKIKNEPNFQELILIKSNKESETRIHFEENLIMNNSLVNNYSNFQNKIEKDKVKVSLDDLFSTLDMGVKVQTIENTKSHQIEDTNQGNNEIFFDNKTNSEKIEIEDLEFLDVEEDISNNQNINGEKSKFEIPHASLPVVIEVNWNNEQIGNDKNSIIPNEVKQEPVKVSIMNFTPVDFLNEFKKENKIMNDENDFNFVEETVQSIEEKSTYDYSLPPMEMIFRYLLKENKLITKFKENLNLIAKRLGVELNLISNNVKKLENFLLNKNFTKNLFLNDRKISNFIFSSLQIVNLANKISTVLEELKMENILKIVKEEAFQTLIDISNTLEDLLGINISIEKFKSKKILSFDEKICYLCLFNLNEESNTNLYSSDFHITCINFWLNLVNNQSPF